MSNPIPQVIDTGRRVARTVIQVGIPAFLALAAGLPVLLAQAKVFVSPNLYAALVGIAAAITAIAALLTRIMAIPKVNEFLELVNLAGHSTTVQAQDSWTSFIPVQSSGDHAAR
jgi:Sec-independent protein secretion pathway component TatC